MFTDNFRWQSIVMVKVVQDYRLEDNGKPPCRRKLKGKCWTIW